jgi:RimJ/RimL family protein N-acetyltransferase
MESLMTNDLTYELLKWSDIEWARQLHNDPDVLCMLTDPHIVQPDEQEFWFAKLEKSKSSQRILVRQNGTPIGLIRVDSIDYANKSVCVGLDIHKDFRGQGFARQIYEHVFEHWFKEKDFHRVWLLVAGYNKRAIHLYHSLGFIDEGCQREALFKNGNYYSYYMMSVLQNEYFERIK